MDEQLIFTTHTTGAVANIHSFEQSNLRQCTVAAKNSAVQVGDKYLYVAQAQKALINVYNISGSQKRESIEQRLPLPEIVNCLEVVENLGSEMPYLLLASTPTGKLYVWEINSGILLSVKPMAHYQAITKIKSFMNGKYVITSGKDSRVMIWQTMDLVSMQEPKPVVILHDHTLPVTDFQVSTTHGEFLSSSGIKLFTASEDATVRCYDLNMLGATANINKKTESKNQIKPKLLATFALPFSVTSLVLDPADRAVYIGTASGCFHLPLFYSLSGNRMVNLTQSSGERTSNKGKLFALTELLPVNEGLQKPDELFATGQLLVSKITDVNVQCLQISLDGTLILVGDSTGKLSITEIYSKQILRTIQPLTTQQTIHGGVTNILVTPQYHDYSEEFTGGSKSSSIMQKLPNLQRVVYDSSKLGQLHDIWHQITTDVDLPVLPLSDFDQYMDSISTQEAAFFTESNNVVSNVKVVGETESTGPEEASSKDQEIAELKNNIETLTNAYKDLREMHEKLFKENEQLQDKSAKS